MTTVDRNFSAVLDHKKIVVTTDMDPHNVESLERLCFTNPEEQLNSKYPPCL